LIFKKKEKGEKRKNDHRQTTQTRDEEEEGREFQFLKGIFVLFNFKNNNNIKKEEIKYLINSFFILMCLCV
jgi:hypothetical protein